VAEPDATAAEAAVTPDGLIFKYKSPAERVSNARAAAAQVRAAGTKGNSATGFDPSAGVSAASNTADASSNVNGTVVQTSAPAPTDSTGAATGATESATPTGNRKLLTIFGGDDRLEIRSAQQYPWTVHGLVEYRTDLGSFSCSGSVIGPNAVLTAAHCILGSTNNVASSWRFSANRVASGTDRRFGTVGWRRVFYNTGYWTTSEWWLWDIAVVILDTDLGSRTGYLGHAWADAGYTGSLVTAGYPGDKAWGSLWYINGGSACWVTDTDGRDSLLNHWCDIVGGQSGSPMWAPGARQVRAVVSAEDRSGRSPNIATSINRYWFDHIESSRFRTS
jgi:V8-like Glu-specific endopeptidase